MKYPAPTSCQHPKTAVKGDREEAATNLLISMNKQEAAEFLGVSVRALERYVQQGRLGGWYEKGKTRPTLVFDIFLLSTGCISLTARV